MECFIHIGTAKTGTTAIQSFLEINKNTLNKLGYYVDFDNSFNHWPLALISLSEYREDIILNALLKFANVCNQEELDNYVVNYIKKLEHVVNANKDKKFIFSSENIQMELKDKVELQNLKGLLNRLGFTKIVVIVYLREPYSLACSLFSEIVKHGYSSIQPPEPQNKFFNHVCNHKNTLQLWESVFGKENIFARAYDRTFFHQNSLIHDFLYTLKIDTCNENFDFSKHPINKGIANTEVLIRAALNKQAPSKRGKVMKLLKDKFVNKPYTMPPHLKKMYHEEFSSSIKWVLDNYFQNSHKPLFQIEAKDNRELSQVILFQEDIHMIVSTMINSCNQNEIYSKLSGLFANILNLEELLSKDKKYLFYGYGYLAKIIEKLYSQKYNLYFMDKDLSKVDGKKVFHDKSIISIDFDIIFICIFHDEVKIKNSLISEYKIDAKKILYLHKEQQ
jgi:hypothetical protein